MREQDIRCNKERAHFNCDRQGPCPQISQQPCECAFSFPHFHLSRSKAGLRETRHHIWQNRHQQQQIKPVMERARRCLCMVKLQSQLTFRTQLIYQSIHKECTVPHRTMTAIMTTGRHCQCMRIQTGKVGAMEAVPSCRVTAILAK